MQQRVSKWVRLAVTAVAFVTISLLQGCLEMGGSGSADASGDPPSGNGNRPPVISGTPANAVVAGKPFSFQPSASDPDGDPLTYSIQNKPGWATFDRSTGKLSGVPGLGDVGRTADIRISVSDGTESSSLNPFFIDVTQVGDASVTLSWTPPTRNTDGTVLTDLAGYRIYYGQEEGSYPFQVTIDNPGMSSYVVTNLAKGRYYFVATSFNSIGVESAFSNVAVMDAS